MAKKLVKKEPLVQEEPELDESDGDELFDGLESVSD